MGAQYRHIRTLFLFILSFHAFTAACQPTLPDIAGAADKGIVILSWSCQYSGVKSITVLHSVDSVFNYSIIGKVKKLDKGVQAFVDGHPAAGKNYYKLSILFASGLSWGSNRCTVTVDKASIGSSGMHLQANDSLQRYLVTSDTLKAGQISTIAESPQPPKHAKSFLDVEPEDSDTDQATAKQNDDTDNDMAAAVKPALPKRKVFISFGIDTPVVKNNLHPAVPAPNSAPGLPHHKVTISFEEPDANTPTFIRSQYIYTDTATGHIKMNLPDDIATHHYSVKFYNDQNRVIVDIPRINAAQIIIDKRNFQRKGIYRFILRRDVVELEAGYVEVK